MHITYNKELGLQQNSFSLVAMQFVPSVGPKNILPAQRYGMWDEEARPTELYRQLKIVVGEENVDETQLSAMLIKCAFCSQAQGEV